ncbi:tripartite tricarboxylate transporter substrate binding protein [Variovorax sp. J22R133]|uniref:tripartite tricarboxylate transporter substrate binding protein n=1 Tax=Variovorax brevis TaxID=3053503 RepID=UPI002577A4F6|nr:tripartite tricarboxylate transporter substrate binding protein [Variovorax sp. J22R133]MDM0116255.1 tripartite tricarboxylate transporter substrate binding protein [Variovorax sp. J22R133]
MLRYVTQGTVRPLQFNRMAESAPLSRVLRGALAVVGLLLSTLAFYQPCFAQSQWPSRPVKLVVPFAPGSSVDAIARAVAAKLASRLGQPVVVENKVGAGGVIGMSYVAHQSPDGYTLLLASNPFSTSMLIGLGSSKPAYDALKDFTPVGQVGAAPYMFVVESSLGISTLAELVELARSKPGSVNYGSAGSGSMNHLGVELLSSVANIKLTHIPYTGLAPAITGFMGGQVQLLMPSLPAAMSYVRSGKMRALAVTTAKRSSMLPEVPTVAELGFSGFEIDGWWGILAPAGLPAPVLKRLNEELNSALESAEMRELLARDGASPRPGTPQEFSAMLRQDVERWARLIKSSRIE